MEIWKRKDGVANNGINYQEKKYIFAAFDKLFLRFRHFLPSGCVATGSFHAKRVFHQ